MAWWESDSAFVVIQFFPSDGKFGVSPCNLVPSVFPVNCHPPLTKQVAEKWRGFGVGP